MPVLDTLQNMEYAHVADGDTQFKSLKPDSIPETLKPKRPEQIEDWVHGATIDAKLISLAKTVKNSALPAVCDFFHFDHPVFGIRADDLFSLNSLMGATVEDQVVSILNRHREIWDSGADWSEYSFVRSAQAFPDVRLAKRDDPEDILFGIELKSWFLLAKESVPTMRFVPHPDACAPLDMICIFPWYLDNAVCGRPKVASPWIEQARFASLWSQYYWTYLRETKTPMSLEERGFKQLEAPCTPYPQKADKISVHPKNDSGGNYGRLPRYQIMDDFCVQALKQEILGIDADSWRLFLKLHTEAKSISEIKAKLSSMSGLDSSDPAEEILVLLETLLEQFPQNLIR